MKRWPRSKLSPLRSSGMRRKLLHGRHHSCQKYNKLSLTSGWWLQSSHLYTKSLCNMSVKPKKNSHPFKQNYHFSSVPRGRATHSVGGLLEAKWSRYTDVARHGGCITLRWCDRRIASRWYGTMERNKELKEVQDARNTSKNQRDTSKQTSKQGKCRDT